MPVRKIEDILFEKDKKKIENMVISMVGLVMKNIVLAVESVLENDLNKADYIIKSDKEIDALELEIDKECLSSIAMRQPLRDDLRFVFVALKIITDIERIGDQAVNIARKVKMMNSAEISVENKNIFINMLAVASDMIRSSLNAFVENCPMEAEKVCRQDAELDELYDTIFENLTENLKNSSGEESGKNTARLLWIARHIARAGDHATNMAEKIFFMSTGKQLRREMDVESSGKTEFVVISDSVQSDVVNR